MLRTQYDWCWNCWSTPYSVETLTQRSITSLGEALQHLKDKSVGVCRRTVREGDFLFRQEEPADRLFYIQSGHVRVFLLAADGRERTVRILTPGELAGDYSFYLHTAHNSYAQAFDGPVVAFQIDRPALLALLKKQPALYAELLRILANTTHVLTDIIEDQSFKDLRERVQMALLAIAGRHGTVGPDGVKIAIHLTHETIASIVGASRPRVSVCLSELQYEGFYHVSNQHIVLSSWAAGLVLPP
jgi:CRP/FNR family transcriptional regulator, cyclic AMP receptor protein